LFPVAPQTSLLGEIEMAEVGVGSIGTSSVLASSGVVGTSGADTVIWAIAVKGGSATTRAVVDEGTDGSGTNHLDIIAPINNTVTMCFPTGLYCIGGVHAAITTTAGNVSFVYSQA
jgi:hypothetical protein|tara:strand:+ start:499 stop:846 length:348 start_codon:yes stop_codon:yes gene_type:complete